jgi:NET1-associated nuclear protein 1 (U3 small nucleolar RNA-associated protein 17)
VVRGVTAADAGAKSTKAKRKPQRPTTFVFEPKRQLVVLQSRTGTLQFYDHRRDRHVGDVEVVPFNAVHRGGRNSQQGHGHTVAAKAFSSDGEWMLTIDHRDKADIDEQTSLKFWKWKDAAGADDPKSSTATVSASGHYALDSVMDQPHKATVTSLCYHPTKHLAVTTSMDFSFKVGQNGYLMSRRGRSLPANTSGFDTHRDSLSSRCAQVWELRDVMGGRGFARQTRHKAWHCRSIGGYRECPARCAAFSNDGSVLAIGYQQVVTLWDPETCSLHETLTHPPRSHVVRRPLRPFLAAVLTEIYLCGVLFRQEILRRNGATRWHRWASLARGGVAHIRAWWRARTSGYTCGICYRAL